MTRWRALAAAAGVAGVIVWLVFDWGRFTADFVPLDASRIGPNLVANAVQWVLVGLVVLVLWPPARRRLRAFADRRVRVVRDDLQVLAARHRDLALAHDELKASHLELHRKLDLLLDRPAGRKRPAVRPGP